MKKNKKICFISSNGGHFEQIRQLKKLSASYKHYYIVAKNNSTKAFKQSRKGIEKVYFVGDFSRGKKIRFIFQFILTSFQQFFLFIKERPDVVVTTGAGLVIPTCLFAKLFRKKLVYVESFARIKTLNKTGEFLYKYSDLFIVQWKELLELRPNMVYGGWIY